MFAEDRNNSSRSFLRMRLRSSLFTDGDELEIQLDMLLSEVERRKKRAEAAYPSLGQTLVFLEPARWTKLRTSSCFGLP